MCLLVVGADGSGGLRLRDSFISYRLSACAVQPR